LDVLLKTAVFVLPIVELQCTAAVWFLVTYISIEKNELCDNLQSGILPMPVVDVAI